MKVLSLFDGMSCGRIALERSGISVSKYYASELDKFAIAESKANWPDIEHMGDVTEWREWDIDWASIDLLIGGSPCQGFSFAGKQLAFDDPRSALFFVYVDILNHIKELNPNVKFLLENVKMKREYLAVISEYLGVEPVFINSSLVSAQNRQRFYWANWEIVQPEDRGVLLRDIIETDSHSAALLMKPRGNNNGGLRALDGKTPSMTACSWQENFKLIKIRAKSECVRSSGRGSYDRHEWDSISNYHYRKLTVTECCRLQTVPDDYFKVSSNTQAYKMLGNGFTIDVISHILSCNDWTK